MSEKIDQIVVQLKTLTLLDASKLVSKIEEIFDVDTSISINNTIMNRTSSTEGENLKEQTEFNVLLEKVPVDKKIAILKIIRGLTGLGLKESKTLVDSVPREIREAVTKDVAESIKKQLEEAGAKVSLI